MVSPGLVVFDLRKFPKDDPARFRGAVLDGKGTAMPAFNGRIGDADVDLCGPMSAAGPERRPTGAGTKSGELGTAAFFAEYGNL